MNREGVNCSILARNSRTTRERPGGRYALASPSSAHERVIATSSQHAAICIATLCAPLVAAPSVTQPDLEVHAGWTQHQPRGRPWYASVSSRSVLKRWHSCQKCLADA